MTRTSHLAVSTRRTARSRRLAAGLACALLAGLLLGPMVGAGPAVAQEEELVRFDGGGWGHGVGMSQYGAQGQALEGRTADQILAHYYSGTGLASLDTVPLPTATLLTDPEPLWVNLHLGHTTMTFEAIGGPLYLCQAGDGEGPCPRAETPVPGEVWTFQTVDGGCRFFRDGQPTGAQVGQCRASIDWDPGTRIRVDGTEYAHGTVKIRSDQVPNGFHVSLALGLEDYLRGVAEMPTSWEPEALKAQAIAARTYAVYRFLQREQPELRTATDGGFTDFRKAACWCHVYDSIFDQVYVGWTREGDPSAGPWLQAVEDTAGTVVTYTGAGWADFTESTIAATFYFSSTAGATEANTDGFGSSVAYPYLVSVDDHWSADPSFNPNASWSVDVGVSTIAQRLGWDTVDGAVLDKAAPGARVTFVGTLAGQQVTATKNGAWLRSNLGLNSPHVRSIASGLTGVPDPTAPPEQVVVPFTDIEDNLHAEAIATVWERGIAKGCAADRYCPSAAVNRWQMALFLTRTWPLTGFDLPAPSGDFTDIGGFDVETQVAIGRLATLGITTGCAPDRYCPTDDVSRWQMALFLTRLVAQTGMTLPDGSDQGFTDIGHLSPEAQTAINQLAQLGITTGTSATTFTPDGVVARDQMASFLARTLDLVGS